MTQTDKHYAIAVDDRGCFLFLDAENTVWTVDRDTSEEMARCVLDKQRWREQMKAQMKRLHNA